MTLLRSILGPERLAGAPRLAFLDRMKVRLELSTRGEVVRRLVDMVQEDTEGPAASPHCLVVDLVTPERADVLLRLQRRWKVLDIAAVVHRLIDRAREKFLGEPSPPPRPAGPAVTVRQDAPAAQPRVGMQRRIVK